MVKKFVLFCLIALVSCGVFAQSKPASALSIEKLLQVTKMEALYSESIEKSVQMGQQAFMVLSARESATPERIAVLKDYQAKVAEIVKEEMGWEKMKPLYVQAYAEIFTQKEINDLIAFYRTPTGAATIKKMPALMERVLVIVQGRMATIMTRLVDDAKRQYQELADKKPVSG